MTDIYTRHKPIRNKIRKYTPLSIIEMGINILHSRIDTAEHPKEWLVKNGTYLPWHVLTIIRWVYQYTESNTNLRAITLPEFNDLYNAIYDLSPGVILEGQSAERVLDTASRRWLLYQLPFQVKKHEIKSSFGRQLVMFQDMGGNINLDAIFQSITHISLKDYYDLYLCCLVACLSENARNLSVPFFNNRFPEETVRKFFSVVSLDLGGAKRYIRDYTHPKASIDFQLNEHTPLERYPFFKINDRYIPYSARLLDNSYMNNAYDIFKQYNSDFSNTFGEIFEDYVGKGIEYACSDFMRENEIKRWLPRGSKVADFFIKESNAAILVDAKSTELNPIVRVRQTKELYLSNLRSTIISGVIQLIVTAYHLRQTPHIADNDAIFGIVVTFKEYLIGDGKKFWNDIIGETVEAELQKLGIINPILPENFFFVSIEDFDYLVAGTKERGKSLSEALAEIVLRNKSPETSSLMLKQHLRDMWQQYYFPSYIDKRFEDCFEGIVQRFSD